MKFNTDKIYNYNKGDELFTPKNAITPLIKYLPKDAVIWECAEEVYRNLKENPDAEDVMWAIRDSLILFGTSKRS